jgi:hypothetical protein
MRSRCTDRGTAAVSTEITPPDIVHEENQEIRQPATPLDVLRELLPRGGGLLGVRETQARGARQRWLRALQSDRISA